MNDLYSRATAWTRGFYPGARVGATHIGCGPLLMPLRSSYLAADVISVPIARSRARQP